MPRLSKNPGQDKLLSSTLGQLHIAMTGGDSNTRDALLEGFKRWEYIARILSSGDDIPKEVDFNKVAEDPAYATWLKEIDEFELTNNMLRECIAKLTVDGIKAKKETQDLQDKLDRAMERLIRLETK